MPNTLVTTLVMVLIGGLSESAVIDVSADPASIRLVGPSARHLILVSGRTVDGQTVDLTHAARFRTLDPAIATVDAGGVVRPSGDGRTTIGVDAGGRVADRRGAGRGIDIRSRSFNFENDIVPVLSKLGCNASGCHGKAEGKTGSSCRSSGSTRRPTMPP